MVAYIVVVTKDETSARGVYQDMIGDTNLGPRTPIAVSGVDEDAAFEDSELPMVKIFLRRRNVVAAIACGGEAASGAEWYVSLVTRKLEP
jgi:hypothetical protein